MGHPLHRRSGYGLHLGDGLIVLLLRLGLGFEVGDGFFGGPFLVYAYVFGFGLDLFARFGLVVFFVFFLLEVFSAPGIFTQRSFAYGAGIDDHASLDGGLEIDAAEVGGGGLQGIEQEAGGFRVHLSIEDEAHDLHERDLDGVGVLEHGQVEYGAGAAGAVGVEDDAGFLPAFVEEAEVVASEGGRSALGAVDFEVLATRNAIGINRHEKSPPPFPLIYWNQRDSGGLGLKSLSKKGLRGKSWKQTGCGWGKAFRHMSYILYIVYIFM
jgi:hypothetical protein